MSKFFINRPIVAIVISSLTVIVGAITIVTLPVSLFPAIAPPEVQVQTTYVGADAQTVEQSVATPIEQQMSGVDNMNYMYSVNSSTGEMRLIVDFDVKTDPNTDLILTQLRQAQAASQLPAEVTNFGVTVQKTLTAPLMLISLYSPSGVYDSKFLANYAYINLNDQLTRVPGIGSVQVFGAGRYAMRLWVKPDQLAKLGITVPDIVTAIQSQNTVNPAGQIGGEPAPQGQEFTYSVRAQGRLTSPEEFEQIVVRAAPDGGIVRVKDVARVELGAQDYTVIGHLNGQPSAIIAVYQLPGSNAVQAAEGVKALLAEQRQRLPQGVDYTIALDTTRAVTEGIKEIVETLLIAIVLVIIVVYIFLQGWRATLIPLLAVPVSLVGTFVVFPAVRIFDQHPFAVRPRSGHRPRRGRRHRRGGGGRASHRRRHVAERCDVQSDGRDLGACRGHRSGAFRRVHSHRIHSWHHRAPLSAIRGDHRDLRHPLGLQRAHVEPRAVRPAAAATAKSRGLLRRFFDWFNRGFARATDGYVRGAGALIRKSAVAFALLLACGGLAAFFGTRAAFELSSGRGPGIHVSESAAPQRRVSAENRSDRSRNRRTAGQDAWRRIDHQRHRLQPAQSYPIELQRVLLRDVEGMEGTAKERRAVSVHPPEREPETRRSPARHCVLVLSSGHSRRRNIRRIHVRSRGPLGKDVAFLAEQHEQVPCSRAQAAGIRLRHHDVPAQRAAAVHRRGSRQGAQAGCRHQGCVSNDSGVHGGSFINYFNRFGRQWQVYVEAEGAYRDRAENVGQFYVRNRTGDMVPLSALTQIRVAFRS